MKEVDPWFESVLNSDNVSRRAKELDDSLDNLSEWLAERDAAPLETNELLRSIFDRMDKLEDDLRSGFDAFATDQSRSGRSQFKFNIFLSVVGLLTLIATIIGLFLR